MNDTCDLLVIGAGINGAGIARDAAGRGLSTTLVEMGDVSAATSQWSSKLIHGGLRYLEQYEFRLVREALSEREVLLRLAPHIIQPMTFVLPHDPTMRPVWMIRVGLWMYDHLSTRVTLPGSKGLALQGSGLGLGLKPQFTYGFSYADCYVDDARLTLLNALSAREKGATVLVRTRFEGARRAGEAWEARIVGPGGEKRTLRARAIVNVGGPWVTNVMDTIEGQRPKERVRLVKGSHIVVPRVHEGSHAYILQNRDRRVVFIIPFEGHSLIGTTDVGATRPEDATEISADEIRYLVDAANYNLARPISEKDVVYTFAGVRPLYDDGSPDLSKITRDYVMKVDHERGTAPLLSIFGGKLTTYRSLAETALQKLEPFFPGMKGGWTDGEALPGGDLGKPFAEFVADLRAKYPGLDPALLQALARRHGSRTRDVLGDARAPGDLGRDFGGGLTEREVRYMRAEELAVTAEDMLWRRSKCGLHMTPAQREAVEHWLAGA